jgi:hypothetical protein
MAKEQPFGDRYLYVPTGHAAGGAIPLVGKGAGNIDKGTATRMVSDMTRNLVHLATPTSEGGLATDEDIEAGRIWYPSARQEHARRISSMLGTDHRVGSALISSLSPQTEWGQNLIKTHDIATHGRPTSELAGWGANNMGGANPEFSTDARIRKAHAILNHAQMGGVGDGRFNITSRGYSEKTGFTEPTEKPVFQQGLKTHSFMENIHNPSNRDFVTIDTHAHNAAVGSRTPSAGTKLGAIGRYNTFAQAYHNTSEHLGLDPSETQARVWTTWKRMNPQPGARDFDTYLQKTGKFDDYYSR